MKLPGTGEAASFRFNIQVPLNRRETEDNTRPIIILMSYRLPFKITLDCDSKRELKSKTKSQRITVLLP